MANWSNPQLTSTYTNFVTEVKDRDVDLAKQFDGQTVSNLVTGAIRWDSTANRWKKWTGSAWGELASTYALTGLSTTGTGAFGGNVTITGSLDATSTISGASFAADGATPPANGVYLPAANTLGLATASGGRVFINSGGSLGVGVQNAGTKIEVAGGIRVQGGDDFDGDVGYSFRTNDTDGGMFSPADNEICFATNNTKHVTLKNGLFGIGTANPSSKLHLNNTGADAVILTLSNSEGNASFTADGDKLQYKADGHNFKNEAGNDRVVIDTANTRLIVGASAASHNLHVQGSAKVTGALTVDGGINATITGNAATATDLAINATNRIVTQTSNNATDVLPAGSAGQVLQSNGSSAPSWVSGAFVPTGGIIIWSGAQNAIPTGWALCNGSSGTPDLRNRFVVGAGSTYAVNNTGGSKDAIVVAHTHTTSSGGSHGHGVTDPGHSHSFISTRVHNTCGGGDSCNQPAWYSTRTENVNSATTGISINSGGSHSHSVNSTGSSGTDKNMPPYYALCYIMKT